MVGALSGISECVCDYTPRVITSRHTPTPPGRPQMNIVVDPLAWQHVAIGGALIGVAAALLLWSSGAIAGVSGIFASAVLGQRTVAERGWRIAFIAGLDRKSTRLNSSH